VKETSRGGLADEWGEVDLIAGETKSKNLKIFPIGGEWLVLIDTSVAVSDDQLKWPFFKVALWYEPHITIRLVLYVVSIQSAGFSEVKRAEISNLPSLTHSLKYDSRYNDYAIYWNDRHNGIFLSNLNGAAGHVPIAIMADVFF